VQDAASRVSTDGFPSGCLEKFRTTSTIITGEAASKCDGRRFFAACSARSFKLRSSTRERQFRDSSTRSGNRRRFLKTVPGHGTPDAIRGCRQNHGRGEKFTSRGFSVRVVASSRAATGPRNQIEVAACRVQVAAFKKFCIPAAKLLLHWPSAQFCRRESRGSKDAGAEAVRGSKRATEPVSFAECFAARQTLAAVWLRPGSAAWNFPRALAGGGRI